MPKNNDRLDRIEEILAETAIIAKSNIRQIKNTNKLVGELTNGWGKFVEGLVAPAIPKLFKKFGIKGYGLNERRHVNGQTMEVDVLGVGEHLVLLCSVKSHLQKTDVDEFLAEMPHFHKFFKEYKGRDILGLVAGIRMDERVDRYAESKGLYILGSSGETVKLINKKGFEPKYF